MLHQAPPPPRWMNLSFIWLGWVLETSPSNHYWWRYDVGQWLVFGWFWGWGTSDTQIARQKLAKKITPQSWRPPLSYGCHGAFPQHHRIQQLANMLRNNSMLLKLEKTIVFTMNLLAILRHDASSTSRAGVFLGCSNGRHWEYHTLSRWHWE